MAKISVVIPVYNVKQYLMECVNSVLHQSFSDFQIILIDDGSTDGSGELCDSIKDTNSKITVIHQKNGGLSAARNTGIEWTLNNSECEWISFVDSDDWVHKDYLKLLYEAATENHAKVSVCEFTKTEHRKLQDAEYSNPSIEVWSAEEAYTLKTNGPAAYAWNKLYSVDCFEALRYPVGKYWEDLYLTHKILLPLKSIPVVRVPLYYYYTNPQGIIHSKWSDRHSDYYESNALFMDYVKSHGNASFYRKMLNNYVYVLNTVYGKVKDNGVYSKNGVSHRKVIKKYARETMIKHFKMLTWNEKKELLYIIVA